MKNNIIKKEQSESDEEESEYDDESGSSSEEIEENKFKNSGVPSKRGRSSELLHDNINELNKEFFKRVSDMTESG